MRPGTPFTAVFRSIHLEDSRRNEYCIKVDYAETPSTRQPPASAGN
jgi:hypothetical protein